MKTSNMKSTTIAGYIARSTSNPKLILAANGELLHEDLIGPGARSAKVYKTEAGVRRNCPTLTPSAVNDYGIEISWLTEKFASGGLAS